MQFASIFEQFQTMFTGESERQLVDCNGFSDQVRLRENSVDVASLPPQGLTEQERLSYVVHAIERQCQIVPVGSYKKNTLGYVQKNDAFRGMRLCDQQKLDSYMHLRKCEQSDIIEQAAREEDILIEGEFLDCAKLQKPKDSWTIQNDEVQVAVTLLKSRVWPGFTAFARANSAVFGSLYIGNGIKQVDLPFMM